MKHEYKGKVIQIGKNGICLVEDLKYFLPNLPSINYSEPVFYSQKDLISNMSVSNLINYIKGLHHIELTYREYVDSEFGFGSPSKTYELLSMLDSDNQIKLYDWIAFNGGNFFIPPNITYWQNEKDKEDKILKKQQQRVEAVANRKVRKDSQIEDHSRKRDENSALRAAELDGLCELSSIQQLKAIIHSGQHLDYYPKEYSAVTKDMLLELNESEREILSEKLKRIKENSWWQKLKLQMEHW